MYGQLVNQPVGWSRCRPGPRGRERIRLVSILSRAASTAQLAVEENNTSNSLQLNKSNILGFGADLADDHPVSETLTSLRVLEQTVLFGAKQQNRTSCINLTSDGQVFTRAICSQGYRDLAYKRRRTAIAQLALHHQDGEPLPRLEYLPEEKECWATVLRELRKLYPGNACQEFLRNLKDFNFHETDIPQLEDVSQFLRSKTGWKINPVAGLLHPRDFLNGLAFKTFHSTQYMRHSSQPMYTPEPDVCHELLGHAVMLADPHYAELVQTIGLASLKADEKQIWHLTKVYWYTVEFGCVQEGDQVKAFGAGLLSSYGEMQHLQSGKAELLPFDPLQKQPKMSYKDGYQKSYFVLGSFETGAQLLQEYCQAITSQNAIQQNLAQGIAL